MMLGYLLIPLLCIIYGSVSLQRLFPAPYWLWAAIFAVVITGVNLKGIRTASSVNLGLMLVTYLGDGTGMSFHRRIQRAADLSGAVGPA
jgi:hypothetical protein